MKLLIQPTYTQNAQKSSIGLNKNVEGYVQLFFSFASQHATCPYVQTPFPEKLGLK